MTEHLILSKVQHLFNVKLGIVSHDTKPENYLLSKMGYLVLTDFGLSMTALGDNGCTNTLCGTLAYMAPKVLKSSGSYDLSVNWWSLAILLYVMPTGSVSLKGKVPDQIAKNISKMKVNYPNYLTPNTKDLIIHLLCKKPAQCIGYGSHGMANIQKHQLLASIKGHSRLADLNVHLDSAIAPAANTTADIDPATMFLGFSYITTLVIDTNN